MMKLWIYLLRKLECSQKLFVILFLKCLHIVLGICFALMMRRIIDESLLSHSSFVFNALIFIIIVLLQIIVSAIIYHMTHHLEIDIDQKLKSMMMTTLLSEDYKMLSGYHSGELMNKYSSDLSLLATGISKHIPNFITMIIRIIFVMIVLNSISPLLSILLFIGGIVLIVCAYFIKKILKPINKQVQMTDDLLKSHVQECMESLLVIHSFHVENSIYKINQDKMNNFINAKIKKINIMNMFESLLSLAVQGAYIIGFLFAVYGVMNNQLSIGSISAIVSLIGQIKNPFVGIGMVLPTLIVMSTNIERIKDLITYNELKPLTSSYHYYNDLEEIVYDHISFSYNEKEVIKDFSLTIKKGESIAFVGYSGVGKTTLLKLLMNIYSLDKGRIYLKFKDRTIDIKDIGYGLISYVPQDYGLMSGTIKEAVAFGTQNIDMNKVIWACQKACIHDFIIELKEGYNTILNEQGKSLSGGQMQRIALARALYSDCPIMLLDEVTSSLNPQLEFDILKSLKELKDKTLIIVSHRQDVVSMCDRVIDFDEVLL